MAAIRAKALVERGKYKEAEELLRPVAQRQPVSDAALELGLLLDMLGRAEGTQLLTRIADGADTANRATDLARSARALRALGRFNEANAVYRDAATAAPRDVAIQTAWGEMFVEGRCQTCNADALKSFQAALKEDARWVPAMIGMARAILDENPPEAVGLAKKALEINASSVPAQIIIATDASDARKDDARAALTKALEVNPSSLEAHALLAAVSYVEDKTAEYDEHIKAALAIAPSYGEAYRVAAELAAYNYRYDEAVALARKALAIDPSNAACPQRSRHPPAAHGRRARRPPALEQSSRTTPSTSSRTTCWTMMDTLDDFVTITRRRPHHPPASRRGAA